jgi:hypothetical protein
MIIARWEGTITVLTPLAHNSDEPLGVDTKFRRIKYFVDGKGMEIPVYSGNAFRGILRRILARDFLNRLGIERVSDRLYYTFFSGGALDRGSSQEYIDVGLRREMRRNIRFLSLLGAAFQNNVLPGILDVGIGIPIAKETKTYTGIESEQSVFEMLTEIFYTRRDDLEDRAGDKEDAQQMRYTIECLVPGTRLHHTFTLTQANTIEQSCFGAAISLFLKDPILGGKSGTGHGKVKLDYSPEFPQPDAYWEDIEKRKEEIAEYVLGLDRAI